MVDVNGACFFFQAEDGIRDGHVTGVQTCALPIWATAAAVALVVTGLLMPMAGWVFVLDGVLIGAGDGKFLAWAGEIGRASCRERGEIGGGAGGVTKKKNKRE